MDDVVILIKTKREAHKYLAGHLGYTKYANVYTLNRKLFYIE